MASIFLFIGIAVFSCGKKEGNSNSGVTSEYYFVYFGNYGSSTITAFWLQDSGYLVSLNPSNIATGAGTSSINDIAVDENSSYIYAANRNSGNISWYSVSPISTDNTSGNISFESYSNTTSGTTAIKIHPDGNYIYSVNATALSNNLNSFAVNTSDGSLAASATFYNARTAPYDLEFTYGGTYLHVVNRSTSDITTYSVSADGTLATLNLSDATATNPEDILRFPRSLDNLSNVLYVAGNGDNRIYIHNVNLLGAVTPASTAYVNAGNGLKKLAITKSGSYLYATNNTDNTIGIYSVDNQGIPTLVSSLTGPTGAGVYALAVSPDDKYLIVTGDSNSKAYVYEIDSSTGLLTSTGVEYNLGPNPRSIVIVPLSVVE